MSDKKPHAPGGSDDAPGNDVPDPSSSSSSSANPKAKPKPKGLARFKLAGQKVINEERKKRPMKSFADVVQSAMLTEDMQEMLDQADKKVDEGVYCAADTFVNVGFFHFLDVVEFFSERFFHKNISSR